jgi:hypothetical protein
MIQHQTIMNDLTDTTNTLTSQIITNNSTTSNNTSATECENLLIETKQEPKYAINELENINSKLDDNNNNTTNLIVKSSQTGKKQNLKRKKSGQLKSSKIRNSKDLDKDIANDDGDLDEEDLDNENEYENENKLKLESFYSNPYGTSHQYNSNNNYYGMIPNMNIQQQQTQIQYNNQQLQQQQQQQMYPWMKDGRNQNMFPTNNPMAMNTNANIMGQIGINVNQMPPLNSTVLSPNKLNQQNNRYFTNGTTNTTTNKSSIMIDSNLANTTILSSGSGASTSPSTSSSLNQNDSITTPTTGKISKLF